MRGKKAKALRKQAEQMTVGKKSKDYGIKDNSTPLQKKRPSLILHPECTRAVYQGLKKAAKRK